MFLYFTSNRIPCINPAFYALQPIYDVFPYGTRGGFHRIHPRRLPSFSPCNSLIDILEASSIFPRDRWRPHSPSLEHERVHECTSAGWSLFFERPRGRGERYVYIYICIKKEREKRAEDRLFFISKQAPRASLNLVAGHFFDKSGGKLRH